MDRVLREWLARAPVLLTAYLVWGNRGRQRRRTVLAAAVALCIAWMSSIGVTAHAHSADVVSTLAWLHRHDLFWATLAAMMTGLLVYRRRALHKIAASRSWTAALPVARWTVRWQALAVESMPALVLAGLLAVVWGSLSLIGLVDADIPAPLATWAATTGGVLLGAGLGHVLPLGRAGETYEGSRYVPHRRRAETPVPIGSLAALGVWPVRQMFASAQPKTMARAVLPVLLAIPLQSTAGDALLAMALLTLIGALVLLVVAAVSVSAKASRWLRPLSIASGLLARRTLLPTLATMLAATSIESCLMWVHGSPLARCVAAGVVTLMTGASIAVAGSLLTIYASTRASRARA